MNYRTIRTVIYSTLLLFVFMLPASAQQKNSKKVTLNIHNGTLESIIQSIMKQTSIRIVYNQELLQKVAPMNFTANNEELKPVIKRLLKGSNLTFVLQDDVMVIGPKEDQEEEKKKTGIIKGQVLDDTGKPMAVVTVSISGTAHTSFTNEEGKFAIEMEDGNSITFSYVGFQKKIIKPQLEETVNVKLLPDQNDMDEVVVTGYQTISKRLSASSTFTLKFKDIKEPGVPNITSMLQGKVPGLSVINNSGSPNAVPTLRVRGTATLMGNANPIWVVDGVVRENPTSDNPDNVMGIDPTFKDKFLNTESSFSKASLIGNSISGLNVNDIESITFLKDASATALYGTSAANGVIVVTTRKGAKGDMTINYNFNTGFTQKPSYSNMKLMNSQQRVRFSQEIYQDDLKYPNTPFHLSYEGAFQDLMNRKITETEFQQQVARYESMNTDWFDLLFQNSLNMAHSVSLSGGSDKIRYYSSLSYDNSAGSAKKDLQRRIGGRMKLDADITSKLSINFSLDGGQRTSDGYFTVNPLDYALKTSRAIPSDVPYPTQTTTNNYSNPYGGNFLSYNILNEIDQTGSSLKNTDLNAVLGINYAIIPGLKFNSLLSAATQHTSSEQYATEKSNYVANLRGYDFGSVTPGGDQELGSMLPYGGMLQTDNSSTTTYNIRNSFDYTRRLFGERDQINILAGQEIRSTVNQGFSELTPGYLRDKGEAFAGIPASFFFYAPKKTNTIQNALSGYAAVSYSYADKYILNANIRTDASNRFGQYSNSRFLPVWSVSGLWNVSDEEWLKNSKVINSLSIKGSYGFQGNVVTAVGPDIIVSLPVDVSPVDPLSHQYILGLKSLPYPNLRWEKTSSYNLELNTSLFNSFISLAAGYYFKKGTDIITLRKIPVEYGIPSMYINGGDLSNHGVEGNLVLNPIRTKDFGWTISVNASKNFNSVGQATDAIPYTITDYLQGTAQIQGKPVSSFYVFSFKGLDPKNGLPLFNHIDDGTPVADKPFTDLIEYAGKRQPDLTGGLFTSFRYKAFSMDFSFAFSFGGKRLLNEIYAGNQLIPMPDQNLPATFDQHWRKPGDEAFTNVPAFTSDPSLQQVQISGNTISRYYMYDHSDLNLVSANFLRCRAMNLSYSLPAALLKRLKIKNASVSANVSNLFVIADKKLKGQDPEISGVGTTALPIVSSYNLGFNISF